MATHINSTQTFTATGPKPAIQSQPLHKPKVAAAGQNKDTVNIGRVKFAGGDHKETDSRNNTGGILNNVLKAGKGAAAGTLCFLTSNIITIPAGIMMMCTGVGILPGLATILLGPFVAGALGAYFGSR